MHWRREEKKEENQGRGRRINKEMMVLYIELVHELVAGGFLGVGPQVATVWPHKEPGLVTIKRGGFKKVHV